MAEFKFSNVKAGDVLTMDFAITPGHRVTGIKMPSSIKGHWNEDHTKFTVEAIGGDSDILVSVKKEV